jgi:hypothetical protein
MAYLVSVGYNSHVIISYGIFSCFRDATCLEGVECDIPREVIWVVIWEYGVMYVRWTNSTMVFNKAHYGSWIE